MQVIELLVLLPSVYGDGVSVRMGVDDDVATHAAAASTGRAAPFFFIEEALEVAEQVLVLQDEVEPAIHGVQHADVPQRVRRQDLSGDETV